MNEPLKGFDAQRLLSTKFAERLVRCLRRTSRFEVAPTLVSDAQRRVELVLVHGSRSERVRIKRHAALSCMMEVYEQRYPDRSLAFTHGMRLLHGRYTADQYGLAQGSEIRVRECIRTAHIAGNGKEIDRD